MNDDAKKRIGEAVAAAWEDSANRHAGEDQADLSVAEDLADVAVRHQSDDDLIELLDYRLREQGLDPNRGGVEIVVNYLRDGWSVLAFPPEVADQFEMQPVTVKGPTIPMLAAELRRRLAGGAIIDARAAEVLLALVSKPERDFAPEEKAAILRLEVLRNDPHEPEQYAISPELAAAALGDFAAYESEYTPDEQDREARIALERIASRGGKR